MTLQARAQLAQCKQLFAREVAGLGEHGVKRRRRMPLGQDEAIALFPVGTLGIVLEHTSEVQRAEDVGAR